MPSNFIATEVRGNGRPIVLRPLHPNAGLEAFYRKQLKALIDEMDKSVRYWIESSYRQHEPLMAMDDILPANALTEALNKMAKRWLKRFDLAAPKLADYFSLAVKDRTDKALASILRKGGWSVKFTMTNAMKDVVNAVTTENVGLIKSIPQQYLKNVEGAVMRSIQTGRDLGTLAKDLEKNYGVTKRRAAFIARDQNNKATSAMNRARQAERGITQAKWRHSGGGKHPRPTHVANDGELYDVAKGWYDPHVKKWIFPGELPNCRCVSISVIPGFDP